MLRKGLIYTGFQLTSLVGLLARKLPLGSSALNCHMIAQLFELVLSLSPALRRRCWHRLYQALSNDPGRGDFEFMNFGYKTLDGRPLCDLPPERERYRHQIQLYHFVAHAAGVTGRDVLEVGSGRGGGCWYVMTALEPRSMRGIDFSDRAVSYSKREYKRSGLDFEQGDAENLPFDNDTFDVVLNVESSHCYGSFPRFVKEALRVTRPGGHMSFCDLRLADEIDDTRRTLLSCGYELVEERFITKNVVASLDADSDVKEAEIRHRVPEWAIQAFLEFSGIRGTRVCEELRHGHREFIYCLLRKPP